MQNIYAVEYNNLGMDLNYEIYDSLGSAKERFNELVNSRRYDMVLLCKKHREIKAQDIIELFINGIRQRTKDSQLSQNKKDVVHLHKIYF